MRSSFRKNLAAFFLFAIITAALFNFFAPGIKGFVFGFSGPSQKTVWSAGLGISDFFQSFRDSIELQKQNDNLLRENENLRSELVQMKDLEGENAELRIASGMQAKENFQLVLAEIAGRGAEETLFIDKGAKDGIRKGMAVISGEKVIYGLVNDVYASYSTVRLLSHKESSINVRVLDTDISGAVRGGGNGRLVLDLVAREKELKADGLIITSPLANDYPSGLVVGHNGEAQGGDAEPFQQAPIKQSSAVEEHRFIFVVTDF